MFLLRHGQSQFNAFFEATHRDPGIADPELTPLGHEQALWAARELADKGIKRVMISPYTRTLQTAAPFLQASGLAAEIVPHIRERKAYSCDIGSSPARLAAKFPHLEFGHLAAQWWHDGMESEAEVMTRAQQFRAQMRDHVEEKHTLVVSHWWFILALTGQSVANGQWLAFDPA